MSEGVYTFIIFFFGSLLIGGIGVYSIKSKKPVSFFTFYKVSEDEVSNVKSYNKSVGVLWILYGVFWILLGSLYIFMDTTIALIITILSAHISIIVLIFMYLRIKRKYEIKK